MQINCNSNDLFYTFGSPCDVSIILLSTFGRKHFRNINNFRNIQ